MIAVPTIDIATLAPPVLLDRALAGWAGFAELSPATAPAPILPSLQLADTVDAVWAMSAGLPARPIPPLGCHFLRDVEVSGSGYLFAGERFIREPSHTSEIALDWLQREDFPDNPMVSPRQNRIVIEDPVLLVAGPGSSIFGHWLMDFLPRIVIAQRLLGERLDPFELLLPADAPGWVAGMIAHFCRIAPERIRRFDRMNDVVLCRQAVLPSFAHSGAYDLHPIMRDFYQGFGRPVPGAPRRRICLSRRDQERHTYSYWRIFEARETLERLAVAHGFEIVQPELLDFAGQVDLFRSAGVILGEHGSGMHAAVFAEPGTIVATVGANNALQFQIAAAFEQRSICMRRLQVIENAPGRPYRFTAAESDLQSLLAQIDLAG
jgi:hypothetical protein